MISLFSISCSTTNIIDRELKPTYNSFVEHYLMYVGNPPPEAVEIHLEDLDDSLGYYHTQIDETHIDRVTWLTSSVTFRELLLFHEMGHHILKREHRNNLFRDGCPVSIMYYKLYERCYKKYREYYIEELFSVRNEL